MAESWESISEIVAGKILRGKIALNTVRPEIFLDPYDRMIKHMQDGLKTKEDLMNMVGILPIQAAVEAASAVNGDRVDWVTLLESIATKNFLADKLDKASRSLRKGGEISTVEIQEDMKLLDAKKPYMIPLSEVTEERESFIRSGWEWMDKELGGLPKVGLFTLGAKPGGGKTTFGIDLAIHFAKEHSDKRIGIFTLEMVAAEFKHRVMGLYPDLEQDILQRIVVEDSAGLDVREVANKAAREPKIGLVIVDFADLMIQDDNNESEMAKIYRVLANLAKTMNIPVILIAQFSKEYRGGVPLPRYLRYTSLAEALSWMIGMLYDPSKDFLATSDNITLAASPGKAYFVAWKIRGGFQKHELDNPGAVLLDYNGKNGWGDKSRGWFKLQMAE